VPVVPVVVTSYGAGLTGVRFLLYLWATALGLVPSTLLQVGVGASAGLLVDRVTVPVVVLVVAVGVLAVAVAATLWRRRRAAVPA
jgi:uncharacterized membrane protein YdjX (TVP38/TMEM64 family)